jgi:acyl-CoA thioesterase
LPAVTTFADDTSVRALGGGRWGATISRGWWIERGPNGGYLAAIVVRSVLTEVAEPARRLRTITLHYLRPPVEGPCEVLVTIERSGRTLTTATVRLSQDGKDCVLAVAALALDRPGPALHHHPAPDELERRADLVVPGALEVPFRLRFDSRPAIGTPPFSVGPEAVSGGWIRSTEADPVDDVMLVALTDAWPPAVFAVLEERAGVPTIELTVHLRGPAPASPGWCLVRFETREVEAGYLEESGTVWGSDGRLLAQSRQLAMVLGPG